MAITLPMSRFIQNYNQHLVEAEGTDDTLILQQRAGRPTWVLESEDRARANNVAMEFLAGTLASAAQDEVLLPRLVATLIDSLPWVSFLPPNDAQQFAQEVTDSLRACASIRRYAAFVQLLDEWRNTAEIWSDPKLAASLAFEVVEPLNIPIGNPIDNAP